MDEFKAQMEAYIEQHPCEAENCDGSTKGDTHSPYLRCVKCGAVSAGA